MSGPKNREPCKVADCNATPLNKRSRGMVLASSADAAGIWVDLAVPFTTANNTRCQASMAPNTTRNASSKL